MNRWLSGLPGLPEAGSEFDVRALELACAGAEEVVVRGERAAGAAYNSVLIVDTPGVPDMCVDSSILLAALRCYDDDSVVIGSNGQVVTIGSPDDPYKVSISTIDIKSNLGAQCALKELGVKE
jgi:hypothetical protein